MDYETSKKADEQWDDRGYEDISYCYNDDREIEQSGKKTDISKLTPEEILLRLIFGPL